MHIHGNLRKLLKTSKGDHRFAGPILFPAMRNAREFTKKYTDYRTKKNLPLDLQRAEDSYAMGLIDEILHYIAEVYILQQVGSGSLMLSNLWKKAETKLGKDDLQVAVREFAKEFPPLPVFLGEMTLEKFLAQTYSTETTEDLSKDDELYQGVTGWQIMFHELLFLWITNLNPAYAIGEDLFTHTNLWNETPYPQVIEVMKEAYTAMPVFGPDSQTLIEMLRAPAIAHPDSLQKQLEFIRDRWGVLLGDKFLRLLRGIDYLNEVNLFLMNMGKAWGKPTTNIMDFAGLEEYERFTPDRDWMPKVVMIAKSTLVWLDQLSKTYDREITRLDQIPGEELDRLARYGFNGLWLIGLWERSGASKRIKNLCGNPDAVSSAYSLFDYDIAHSLGGWEAVGKLREECARRGIRLASDMVPNHTGMDSRWVHENPERFIQTSYPPFPGYTFHGENLSSHPDIGIYLEDHYYNQSDASVVFKRVDFSTGDTRYIYHGNDGTHMPWNDTAQLDFLNPETREAVIQTILHVARNFSIIRFDAAMTLAKKHIQRLWYPEAGKAGDIASRAEFGLSPAEFHARIPEEFWREVVDRAAKESPDTLLLAEAFWMMEGYFVRTLGMHRVYNSAFMHMFKNEDNGKYRQTIKNTMEFDKDILKRFVNFMNNPDEETAVAQFGTGDKYFGVCTVMATMPGLPMFGHGQIEGFHEKYGMEYQRAYFNEVPNQELIERHEREIFPILKKRYLFADVTNFNLYDYRTQDGWINENVFAYSNATDLERALVVYNNAYDQTWGFIKDSVSFVEKLPSGDKDFRSTTLAQALRLHNQEGYYLLIWEQRSNLWFIRRSTDIYRDGLFVHMPGYSCQVFMDIHELEDNQFSHYRILHDQLEGRGVRNITQAIRDIILEPVYNQFRLFFTPELLAKFEEILGTAGGLTVSKTKKGAESLQWQDSVDVKAQIAWFKNAIGQFLEPVAQFLASPKVITQAQKTFEASLINLVQLLSTKGSNGESTYFVQKLRSMPTAAVAAFFVLHALGDQDDEWYLEGKVQEITGTDIRLNHLFKWLETYPSWAGVDCKPQTLAEALEVYSVIEYLGANYYNGVMWYRRESFEDFAWWTGFFHCITVEELSSTQVKAGYDRSMAWLKLMEASEYRLNRLQELAAAQGQEKAKATKGKTTAKAATKAPVKEGTAKKPDTKKPDTKSTVKAEAKPASKKPAPKKPAPKKPAPKKPGGSKTKE